MLAGFRRGLSEAGFDDNRNVRFEYRWAEGHYERLPALAADLIAHRPAVIFATGDAPWPAKEATNTIPIVFATGVDPIDTRLVASLDKPGGNVTGMSWSSNALVPKRLELVRDLVPHIGVIGALVNTKNPSAEIDIRALRSAAAALRLKVEVHGASTVAEVAEAFATMARQKVEAVIVGADSFFVNQRKNIVALEARYALPGSHSIREYVVDGGLMSYAPNRLESFRVAGSYVGRILKGEKAADLPVQLPTRFELAINLKTAKTLGLDVPATVLARADEVIE
jgi:putative ABC transport system substrate-binding protein